MDTPRSPQLVWIRNRIANSYRSWQIYYCLPNVITTRHCPTIWWHHSVGLPKPGREVSHFQSLSAEYDSFGGERVATVKLFQSYTQYPSHGDKGLGGIWAFGPVLRWQLQRAEEALESKAHPGASGDESSAHTAWLTERAADFWGVQTSLAVRKAAREPLLSSTLWNKTCPTINVQNETIQEPTRTRCCQLPIGQPLSPFELPDQTFRSLRRGAEGRVN